ncbi:DMT family transporter [Gymnodinialimonas hymeniacidonis]|uniref:DMT family transporter n=1 Tax=Gymnodinialimonas hymeniacidonis TaxID=3126508 RepID=UPI0034C64DDF
MDVRAVLMGLTFALIWSSAFSSARIIVEAAPPLFSLSARFAISGLIGVGIAWALGQGFNLTRSQWRAVLIFGICQNAIYLGLNFVAMQTIEASLAAIIASTMPLLVALANWTIFKERLPVMGIFGMVAGFAGVALIMAQRFEGGADPFAIGLCMIAAVALAAATLTVKSASSDGGNLLMIVGLQMLVGSIALLFPALALEELVVEWTTPFILAFIYTTLMPGLAATFIWFLLVGRIGPTRAATYHFLNPVFGVAIAYVLLSEQLSWIDAVGVAIIAGGILAVQRARIAT